MVKICKLWLNETQRCVIRACTQASPDTAATLCSVGATGYKILHRRGWGGEGTLHKGLGVDILHGLVGEEESLKSLVRNAPTF